MYNKNFHRLISLFLVLMISFANLRLVLAADGALDPTFGNGGIVTTDIGGNDDLGLDVEVQPDGKIIVAGTSSNPDGTNNDFGLARYNLDGSLDTTFAVDGITSTDVASGYDAATAIALQTDGRIIAAGYAHNGNDLDFALTRYNADGSLDTTFDLDGKVTSLVSPYDDYGQDVALQPDGKILLTGFSFDSPDLFTRFVLIRYNSDGSPDGAFGDGGLATNDFGCGSSGHALALQPDGKIIVAGDSCTDDARDFALARFNSDGSPDLDFGTAGRVITDFGDSYDSSSAVAVQPDGKVVLAGHSYTLTDTHVVFALARYNSDGSPDTTFDEDGKVTTDLGGWRDFGHDMVLQPDGKIIVAGEQWQQEGGTVDFALARYNSDGSLDPVFDTDGIVITDISSGDYASGLALQPDGRIIVTGWSDSGFHFDFALARYEGAISALEVTIDIKPGKPQNRIELEKNFCKDDDNLYVALLTTPDFDVQTMDVSSLQLGDPNLSGTVSPVRSRIRDVDFDGDMDMMLAFPLCELVINEAMNMDSTELVLNGNTSGGVTITGRDSVNVVGDDDHVKRVPVFVYPVDGQTLDYEGSYLFRVRPIPSAEGFLWGFFQNGVMVWENYRDEGTLSGNEYGIHPGSLAHSKFVQGDVEVWVRASIKGQWTDATVITIHLQPRSP